MEVSVRIPFIGQIGLFNDLLRIYFISYLKPSDFRQIICIKLENLISHSRVGGGDSFETATQKCKYERVINVVPESLGIK